MIDNAVANDWVEALLRVTFHFCRSCEIERDRERSCIQSHLSLSSVKLEIARPLRLL